MELLGKMKGCKSGIAQGHFQRVKSQQGKLKERMEVIHFKDFILFLIMWGRYVHMGMSSLRGQRKALGALVLEL